MKTLADAGIYVSHVPEWANRLSGYADFAWFVALTAWCLAWMLWRWRPRHESFAAWGWLPWSAGFGVAGIAIHVAHLVFSRVQSSPNGPFLIGDLALGGLAGAIVVAWWWQAFGENRRGRWLCMPLALLLLGFAALRYDFFQARLPSWALAAAGLTAALPWCFRRDADRWSRAAVLLAGSVPLFSTIGPISYGYSMLERYTALSPAALCAGSFQALAALTALFGFRQAILGRLSREERKNLAREARPFLLGGAAWLVFTLAVAWLVGERQRTRTEERALEQVRLAATLFDPAVLGPLVDPRFRLDNIPLARVRNNPIRTAWSDFLATGAADAADRAFDRVAGVARSAVYVRFVLLHDGWLVSPFNKHTPREGWFRRLTRSVGKGEGRVLLLREPTPRDLADWAAAAERIEGPFVGRMMANSHIFVRAPVRDAEKQMAGWLEFTFTTDDFLSETVQARVAPLTGLMLGLIVAGLVFVQLRHARGREAAGRAAVVAAEANRLKTRFLANVSHELRTPLQSVLGHAELLGRHLTDERSRGHLAAQRQQGELMLRLVNDLLDLSAIEAGGFRLRTTPAAVGEIVREAAESFRDAAAAKNLELHVEIAASVPAWAVTDADRLRQIVLNLAGNAVKFTAHGSVRTTLAAVAPLSDSCRLEIVVRDTGPGIAAEDQARLFQPFSRIDLPSPQRGAGLGLALTAALCRSAGGGLTVESDGRSGACFRATLEVQPCAAPAALPAAEPPSLRGRRVLIADDNALIRVLFAHHLAELGAICETVADGEQALAQATTRRFDTLLLDVAMPGLDGFEVARQLRARWRGLPALRIVGVSAHASVESELEAKAAGMDAFLTKPVSLAALGAAVCGGTAPSPVAHRRAELHAELARLFRETAAAERAIGVVAREQRDWPALERWAHRMKSSAGVLQDDELYAACGLIEDAAAQGTDAPSEAAWPACHAALDRWLA